MGAMSSAPGSPVPEKMVGGRFALEDTVGRGGMGAVYRVRDVKTGKRLALKRAWAKNSKRTTKHKTMLEREFHTLMHLRHPRIIEVYEYGVDADGPYYTMELLDGADLDKGGQLQWQEACALLRDLASSLAIVHSRGLVHRDVSGRNVRRTADGRAKLIDFGGMVSVGVANDVIGTPPFMAPEVLQMQAPDGRADLFSLGALGYYLLTGRHAYPARRTSDLRDAWRTRPAPPSRAVPEVPAALSTLILQLLSLDRGSRPQTAAEVMERLCVIADLPKEELPEIRRAYLTTPILVGRQKTLISIRGRMLSLVRGDGGALLLEGSAGSGRSRMLDASVFEGKLLSALVVRAAAEDATGPWGVARAVVSQLFALLPEDSIAATRLSAGVLGHVVDELRPSEAEETTQMGFPERSQILRELRDFVLTLAKKHRLLIAVDDTDRIDEQSAAWLAALADKAERLRLLIVVTMEPEGKQDEHAALHFFRTLAQRVILEDLVADQTEALVRSVFGDVPNLSLFAGRIHTLAHGNPRTTMELAQNLVDMGLARYEAGSWLLPQQLDRGDLPTTLSKALSLRLDELSADARELAEAQCIADAHTLSSADLTALTSHRDSNRLFIALDELVTARVLIAGTDGYRFSQRGFLPALLASMPAARKLAVHARLADMLAETGGELVQRAQHLMQAAREPEAIQLLCSLDLQARLPPLPLLDSAVEYADRTGSLPGRAVYRLRMALLTKAALVLERQSFRRCLAPVIKQLERDSGLALYRELAAVPANERLSRALTTQQERFLALPEHEQVYNIGEAVRELARLTGAACSLAASVFDLELLEELPTLEPLLPLSPALGVVTQLKAATHHWLSGRTQRASEIYEETLTRIAAPDHAGLDESQLERTLLGVQYILALLEANSGIDRAEQRAQLLESRRALRVNAWRVRSLLHLSQGNAEGSHKATRRAELLQLQDDSESHYLGTTTAFELWAYYVSADLLGVKNVVDWLAVLANKYPGWRTMSIYGQSCYRVLLGHLEGALEAVLAGLEVARPGRDMVWGLLAGQHVMLLRELGRADESTECVGRYIELILREDITLPRLAVFLEGALSYAVVGRHAEAVAMIEPVIALSESQGVSGLALGLLYEARARIAISMRDHAGFEQHAARCAHEYTKGHNPAILAKLERLMDDARQHELAPSDAAFERVLGASTPAGASVAEDNTVVSRILECVDASDRARCALTLLLQSTDSYLGHLYGVHANSLVALAGLPYAAAEPSLEHWLHQWVSTEREQAAQAGAVTTACDDGPSPEIGAVITSDVTGEGGGSGSNATEQYVDPDGRCFRAVLLVDEAKSKIAAVLVLQVNEGQRWLPPTRLVTRIANQLLEHGDVPGVVLGEPPSSGSIED